MNKPTEFKMEKSGVWYIVFAKVGGYWFSTWKTRNRASAEATVKASTELGDLRIVMMGKVQ